MYHVVKQFVKIGQKQPKNAIQLGVIVPNAIFTRSIFQKVILNAE